MPLIVPDYVLGGDRFRLADLFLGFACFEFSLKASGFARNGRWRAEVDCEIKRVKNGRVLLIPASDSTAGHGTTGMAKFYERDLGELLRSAPRLVP